MFWGAKSINNDISKWDVSRVWNMKSFNNIDISDWDVSGMKSMTTTVYVRSDEIVQ